MKTDNFCKMWKVLLAFVTLISLPTSLLAQEHDYVFSGSVTYDNIGQYLYFDFDVPQGTTKLYISFSYQSRLTDKSGSDSNDGWEDWIAYNSDPSYSGDKQFDDVLTIAVYDSNGFRGSGLKGSGTFTIALSDEHTSDGYLPGEIPEGVWKVEVGVGFVMKNHIIDYTVTVDLSNEDVGETFVPPDYEPVVLSNETRWYKGDLHCHSTHSDGSHPMGDVFEYAHSIGLDFLALTDHNTLSHLVHIPEYQEAYPDMLLIYGWEVTTFRGHFNVFNFTEWVDYRGTMPGYDINAVFDQVHAKGGYVSPNHPCFPNISVPGFDSYGLGWGFPETDWSKVDFVEAINGPSRLFDSIPNPINAFAIEMWDNLQDAGLPLTIRGGSDDHSAGQGSGSTYSPIGSPTTVVYANELSSDAILEGLKAGHAFLMTEGPDGPEIYLEAKSGDKNAIVGDTIDGEVIDVSARVIKGNGTTLTMQMDGKPMPDYTDVPVDSDDYKLEFSTLPTKLSRLRAELSDGNILKAITNSLYVAPQTSDDDTADDDVDDDTDDDDAGGAGGGNGGCGCGL